MKKFIIKLILFCLPLLLFSYLADIIISNNLKKSNTIAKGEYSVWNDIYCGKINADIVVNGSSRAWVQIDPQLLSNAFNVNTYNLGLDGENFLLVYFRHSLLLKYNIQPKLIIHSLDIFTLEKHYDLYNLEQFLPYMLYNNSIRNATSSYNGFNFFDYIVPSLRYMGRREIIDNTFKSQFQSIVYEKFRINGYHGMDEEWNNDFDNARKKIHDYVAKLDSSLIHLFEQYLIECKEKNIKIIFVYTPEYIDGQKFVKNRDSIIHIYKNFGVKYDIPFYDYSNDTISYQKKYFYNNGHLNKTGSEVFTKKFIEDLKKRRDIERALNNKSAALFVPSQ